MLPTATRSNISEYVRCTSSQSTHLWTPITAAFGTLFSPLGPPKNSCRLQCGAVLRFSDNRYIKVLLLKNSSPLQRQAVFLQSCRPLQQSRASFHRLGGSKSIVFHLFFNTFANWTIFVGVVRRSNGRSLKNSNLKKNACHCSAELFFQSTPRKCLTFFFIFFFLCLTFSSFQRLYVASRGARSRRGGQGRSQTRRLYVPQKHAPCLSRKQNPEIRQPSLRRNCEPFPPPNPLP